MKLPPFAFVAALALLAAGASPAAAEDWDSKRAAELASSLEETIGLALQAADTAHPQRTAMQQRTRDAALIEMKRTHEYSRDYASKVREGWSREDTEPLFDVLRRMTRDARETARNAVPDPAVAPYLESMDELLLDLAKLYQRD
jgi:hypothetical protein